MTLEYKLKHQTLTHDSPFCVDARCRLKDQGECSVAVECSLLGRQQLRGDNQVERDLLCLLVGFDPFVDLPAKAEAMLLTAFRVSLCLTVVTSRTNPCHALSSCSAASSAAIPSPINSRYRTAAIKSETSHL